MVNLEHHIQTSICPVLPALCIAWRSCLYSSKSCKLTVAFKISLKRNQPTARIVFLFLFCFVLFLLFLFYLKIIEQVKNGSSDSNSILYLNSLRQNSPL